MSSTTPRSGYCSVCSSIDQKCKDLRCCAGTHTADAEANHVVIAECRLPSPDAQVLAEQYSESTDIYGGFGGAAGKIEVVQRIIHDGEVNRARYMPQNADLIATKTKSTGVCSTSFFAVSTFGCVDLSAGLIYIFDRTKHPSKPPRGGKCTPNLKLTGHDEEGYGLDWSIHNEGWLLSGAGDKLICFWDITQADKTALVRPVKSFRGHEGLCVWFGINTTLFFIWTNVLAAQVEDVSWHKSMPKVFASVSDDRSIKIWNLDTPGRTPETTIHNAHGQEINCCSFSPFNEHLLVTGSTDRHVALWDLRNTNNKVCVI